MFHKRAKLSPAQVEKAVSKRRRPRPAKTPSGPLSVLDAELDTTVELKTLKKALTPKKRSK